MSFSDVLAIIPARACSKRLPNKNNKLIKGVPLWLNSVNIARAAGIKEIVVSSDDEDILDYGEVCEIDGYKIIKRSEEASTDEATIDDVVRDVLNHTKSGIFCVLQPTSPLLLPSTLKHALEIFINRPVMNCLVAVNQIYKPCGAFYIFHRHLFECFDTVWMKGLGIYVIKDFQALDIDYIWDYRIAEGITEGRKFVQEVVFH